MNKLFILAAALLLTINAALAQTTWTGNANSTAWGNSGNWNNNVPTATVDAIIPSGRNFYPVLTVNGTCRALSIASGASVTVNSTRTLTINHSAASATTLSNSGTLTINGQVIVKNSIVNNGTVVCGPGNSSPSTPNGQLTFDNTLAATVSGTGTMSLTDVKFSNLATVTFASSLTNQVKISRVAQLRSYNVTTNGKVRLTSDAATTTGMIDDSGSGRMLGDITVERDIDGTYNSGMGYRHYSTPVKAPAISTMATTGFTPIVNGTYSYPFTTSMTPFPNIFYYNEALVPTTPATRNCAAAPGCVFTPDHPCKPYQAIEYGWQSPSSTSDTLMTTRGYTVMIDDAPTIALTGTANTGTYSTPTLGRGSNADAGWHFIGNPYPSPISIFRAMADNAYDSSTGAGFDGTVWFWRSLATTSDPCNPVVLNGDYQWLNTVTGESSDGSTEFFPVMQGFWVRKPSGSTPSVFTFTNSHRETTYPTSPVLTPFYRSSATTTQAVSATFLVMDKATKWQDKAMVGFRADAHPGHDAQFDVVRPADNELVPTLFTLNQDAEKCAYNVLPTLTRTVTLPLAMHTLVPGHTYSITLNKQSLPAGTRIFLDDRQTGASRELTRQPGYDFVPNSASYDNRFVLRFEPATEATAASTAEQVIISTYPNPAQVGTPLEFQSKAVKGTTAQATLLDTFGRTITTQEVSVRNGDVVGSLSTTSVKAGIYILRLNTAGTVTTQRIQIR